MVVKEGGKGGGGFWVFWGSVGSVGWFLLLYCMMYGVLPKYCYSQMRKGSWPCSSRLLLMSDR